MLMFEMNIGMNIIGQTNENDQYAHRYPNKLLRDGTFQTLV